MLVSPTAPAATTLMDSLIQDFLQESNENLNRLDHEFVSLEKDPRNKELLGSIFRTIHTIKGTCGFLGFLKLESLAHVGENLLSLLRAGELTLNPSIADALLEMVDAIRAILQEIANTETEGAADYSALIERLKECQQPEKASGSATVAKKHAHPTAHPPVAESLATVADAKPSAHEAEQPVLEKLAKAGSEPVPAAAAQAPAKEGDATETSGTKPRGNKLEGTIRVDVNLLENQMNLVSELVLLRNRLLQRAAKAQDYELEATVHGLNLVTSDLRKNVMKARMQPVSGLYEKLPRIVRDVSKDLGKKIQLETEGGDTELDKTLLEAIKDPVTHILRNSMDHGIELPADRMAAGKTEDGTIRVRAYHEGGNFHLDLSDDGAGIDVNRVKDKAVAKGLITSAQAQKMSEAELQALIFAPGLTTAQKVTNVSGRGVGMDVVKTNIERIGGVVKLESSLGHGTKVYLEIPLTLATIPAVTVESGGSVFAIAQSALVEMLCVDVEEETQRIEKIDGVQMLRFRERILPLLSLREQLSLKAEDDAARLYITIAVVRSEGRQFAIEVDRVRHNEEIVIKPLAKDFKKIGLYSGAAILGDGSVALILDLPALSRRSGMSKIAEDRLNKQEKSHEAKLERLVLVSASHGERMAIPIEYAERLENLSDSARERVGGREVMQYRGQILPLVRLEALLDERRHTQRRPVEAQPEDGRFAAIVVRGKSSTPVIFEVGRILGIVNVDTSNLTVASRSAVQGSLVVQQRVTELLDMEILLQRAASAEYAEAELVHSESGEQNG